MLELLKGYTGRPIEINGHLFETLEQALKYFEGFDGELTIILNKGARIATPAASESIEEMSGDAIYKIKVRQYLTKAPTPEFDLHAKWNNGIPIPMRIMVGKKLGETRGMIQLELWGEILEDINHQCMKCGKALTNPVSKYFGIGPECGGHNYINPFETNVELQNAIDKMQEELSKIRWTGWIPKSGIEEQIFLEYR